MTYRINPLVWRSIRPDWLTADTIFGTIQITENDGVWRWSYCVDEFYDQGSADCDSPEHGKAEAWRWYLGRLMPALEEST